MDAALKAEPGIGRRLGTEPIIAASIYLALAEAFAGRNAFDAARNAYENAAAAFVKAEGSRSADLTILRLRWAQTEALSGRPGSLETAGRLLAEAQPGMATLAGREQEAIVWQAAARSASEIMAQDPTSALRDAAIAANSADRMPDIFEEDFRLILRQREAVAMIRNGQLDAADTLLRGLHARLLALHGENHPELLLVELAQARISVARNDNAQAATTLDRLCPEMVTTFGSDNRQALIARMIRAEVYTSAEDYAKALPEFLDIHATVSAKHGEKSYFAIMALANASIVQYRMGDARTGLANALHAYSLEREVFGENSAVAQFTLVAIANCLSALQRYDEAASRLKAIDPHRAGQADSSTKPSFDAVFDLAKAEVALGLGNTAQAASLLDVPRRMIDKPHLDPFLWRKLHQLEDATAARKPPSH